jgi:transposase
MENIGQISPKIPFSKMNFYALREGYSKINNELEKTKDQLQVAQEKLQWYEEQIRLAKQRRFGRKSEAHILQGELFDELPAEETAQLKPETEEITYTRRKKKTKGRNIDLSKLPHVRKIHDLSDAEKQCDCCGKVMERIGEDITKQLEYIPAKLQVLEHVKYKYACKTCNKLKEAKKPESPLPKSIATASLLTEIIIKKYEHHQPLYRQSKIFYQEGIELPDNTLGHWVMGCGEALEPLRKELWQSILKSHVLQADETHVKVLMAQKKGWMWAYHGCDPGNRCIAFEYKNSREGEAVNTRLADYEGILQTDGYSGYNALRNKKDVITVGCWAHCRRKFAEIVKINKKRGNADAVVKLINKLYKIERLSKSQDLSFVDRGKLRQEKAKPILEDLYDLLIDLKPRTLPESGLGKAVSYALNQWPYLEKYAEHGEVEIDNNWVENQIRPFALGRKNWLFTGNERGANMAALFYSLIQSCRLNKINSRKYLEYVLNQTHRMRRREIDPASLLPQHIDRSLLA